ncbi:hypothetical protein HDK90DRAFT_247212 [Phyllosticta capitalensis]|uniref:Uncharacterized protein n=1 Tax=Phyllosticta capitalensis TaxID=121624 RepID=A0ABR1YPU7_9PEZI
MSLLSLLLFPPPHHLSLDTNSKKGLSLFPACLCAYPPDVRDAHAMMTDGRQMARRGRDDAVSLVYGGQEALEEVEGSSRLETVSNPISTPKDWHRYVNPVVPIPNPPKHTSSSELKSSFAIRTLQLDRLKNSLLLFLFSLPVYPSILSSHHLLPGRNGDPTIAFSYLPLCFFLLPPNPTRPKPRPSQSIPIQPSPAQLLCFPPHYCRFYTSNKTEHTVCFPPRHEGQLPSLSRPPPSLCVLTASASASALLRMLWRDV